MFAKVDNNDAEVKPPFILSIESSCDDTSAAVLSGNMVLSNVIANQDVHQNYGGVVPELASREHQKNIVPVVDAALKKANVCKEQLQGVAFTEGPGLIGSLLVGGTFAKALAFSLGVPLIAVDHMRAHILAHFIHEEGRSAPEFPFLCLTVSGGHTQIVLVSSPSDMKVVGKTIDDAAGEAFDKAAKIMGLGYPGGPQIDRLSKIGDSTRFSYSIPKIEGFDFSFSGIKTSFLYHLQKEMKADSGFLEANISDVCASYQRHIVEYLLVKLKEAVIYFEVKDIALAGGVSANGLLRDEFLNLASELNIRAHIPKFEYCTDNAAMIGIAAYFKYLDSDFSELSIAPKARLPFG